MLAVRRLRRRSALFCQIPPHGSLLIYHWIDRASNRVGLADRPKAVGCSQPDCIPQGSPLMSEKQAKSEPATSRPGSAKVDINSATVDQLHAIRGLGKSRALEIVRYRDRHGAFTSLDELARVPHMGDMPWGELDRVKLELTVHIADEAAPPTAPEAPKVDVNTANVEELRAVEGIGAERAQEIVDWREKYGRFRDVDELDTLPHFKDEPEGQRGPIKARLRV
jgi:competence ComEA-like helix-hairpin-helix protein